MVSALNPYITNYPAILGQLPGQSLPWLHQARAAALAQFSENGFPSPRQEEWRYTNVKALEKKVFSPIFAANDKVDASFLARYQLADAWSVVLVNGQYRADLSCLTGLPDNIEVLSMADALHSHAELVSQYFAQAVADSEHNFVAFNTAWFTDGVFIRIPENQVLAKPIQCLHLVTQEGGLAASRNAIVLEANAETEIIETFAGHEADYLAVTVSEVFVGENAGLTLHKLQVEAENAYHFSGTYIKQAQNARCKHHQFAFGSLLARSDVHADLEQAAECELNGLYLGKKRQHLDNHTRIIHKQPYGKSLETYKGVLADRARGVFQGRVIVVENAQKTDSAMNNRNLLLSADAEADTKPQLEIYADDVKCSHGVTVGQLAEPSVFYLQSRGVDEETARNILTFAFANEMVEKIKRKSLHDLVLAELIKRFPQEGIDQDWL